MNEDVYGVIDIGGASAQIAFVPKGTKRFRDLSRTILSLNIFAVST